MSETKEKRVPLPTVRRLPRYLHLLLRFKALGMESVSATDISNNLALESIQVRKDLAYTGIVGKPRVGYSVAELIKAIENFLGWSSRTRSILVGAGSLGSALLGYTGFEKHGLHMMAAFDSNPAKAGLKIHDIKIHVITELKEMVKQLDPQIAIMTVPANAAQVVADLLVSAGIKGIWNFSPTKVTVPNDVIVQDEDLSAGLAVLSIKMGHKI